jgi:hypothetical protein
VACRGQRRSSAASLPRAAYHGGRGVLETGEGGYHEGVPERELDERAKRRRPLLPLRSRAGAGAFSVALLLLVLSPVYKNCLEEPEDDFPVSHFPMFSTRRGDAIKVTHFVGVDASGKRTVVPFGYMGARGENTARKQISRIVNRGGAPGLCQTVAAAIAGDDRRELAGVEIVQVITGEYEFDRFYRGEVEPREEVVHAQCRVLR